MKKCYNKYCNKELTEEDKTNFGFVGATPTFLEQHLCNSCWYLFDGQKMRGRFKSVGISHQQLVSLGQLMDQIGGCGFTIGHPSEEERYTESMSEWIEWQKPNQEL